MKKKTEDIVRDGLLESGMVIPLSSDRVWAGWEFLCRQIPGQERSWLQCVENLLRWANRELKKGDEFMVARKYLLKDDRMVFGWYLRLRVKTAPALLETSNSFLQVLKTTEPVVAPQPPPQMSKPPQGLPAQQFRPIRPSQQTATPTLTVIQRFVDEKGKVNEISEMPLPHVRGEMNVPTKPVWSETHGKFVGGDKGAKNLGGGN